MISSLVMLCAFASWTADADTVAQNGLDVTGTITTTTSLDTSGNDIVLVSMPSATRRTITPSLPTSSADRYVQYSSPVFSPDGSRLAFIRIEHFDDGGIDKPAIFVTSNDGRGAVKVCDFVWLKPVSRPQSLLTWATDDYLYWSEDTTYIYRASAAGGTPTTVCEFHPASEMPQDPNSKGNIFFASLSRDAGRAVSESNGAGRLFRYNVDACSELFFSDGGCRGTISPEGDYVVHTVTGYPSSDQLAYIERFDNGAFVGFITAPGVTPNEESENEFYNHRFSHSSNRHVLCTGSGALRGASYIYDIWDNTYTEIGDSLEPWDFRQGALPAPDIRPVMVADTHMLYFDRSTSSTPRCVHITANTPLEDPCTATKDNGGDWLEVSTARAGDGWSFCNVVDHTGLDTGAYFETVSVACTAAANEVSYRIVFNNGLAIVQPSGLRLTQIAPQTVLASWHDNSISEEHFLLERRSAAGSWELAATVPNNTARLRDTVPAVDEYWYRVRAVHDADTSAPSDTARITVREYPSAVIVSPVAGDTVAPGSSVHIRWRSRHVSTIKLKYTIDGGDLWEDIAVVNTSDTAEGDYVWSVPDIDPALALIGIDEYNKNALTVSGSFAIASNAAVLPGVRATTGTPRLVTQRAAWSAGQWLGLRPGTRLVGVYRLDGSYLPAHRLAGRGGHARLAAGCYLVVVIVPHSQSGGGSLRGGS